MTIVYYQEYNKQCWQENNDLLFLILYEALCLVLPWVAYFLIGCDKAIFWCKHIDVKFIARSAWSYVTTLLDLRV